LAIEGRLDAAIDRATKLYQLQLAGQLRRPNLPEVISNNVRKQHSGPSAVGKTKE
jgi:hypothetical protein